MRLRRTRVLFRASATPEGAQRGDQRACAELQQVFREPCQWAMEDDPQASPPTAAARPAPRLAPTMFLVSADPIATTIQNYFDAFD